METVTWRTTDEVASFASERGSLFGPGTRLRVAKRGQREPQKMKEALK
jgi:hypothetical protein